VRKKKGRGGERLTGGAHMLVRGNKKKKKEATRAGAGEKLVGCWAAWAERSEGLFFFFFKLLSKQLYFSNSNQILSNFSQKFYKLLETTQATKNHARQLMMHNHLLSLCLLNYV
jgi:hypothetical protein